ncbi:unnamed protein product [Caenorhabditis bovis]|uniref:Uncharacterized protein n=1 Tax=Caenorhabditis bovis TaxID=2654633 RepID=A0A8S1EJ41_9PELO|nr:unnamed protein product [Caenorhabditis bovis]
MKASFDFINAQYDYIRESIDGPNRLAFELCHSAQYYAQFVHKEQSKIGKEKLKKHFAKMLKELAQESRFWKLGYCMELLKEFVELEESMDNCTASEKIVRRRQLIVDLVSVENIYGVDSFAEANVQIGKWFFFSLLGFKQ